MCGFDSLFSVKPQTIYFYYCNYVTVIEEEWISICCMWFQPKSVGNIQSINTTLLIFANSSIKPFLFYWAAEWLQVVGLGWARVKCGLFKWRMFAWQKFTLLLASCFLCLSVSRFQKLPSHSGLSHWSQNGRHLMSY